MIDRLVAVHGIDPSLLQLVAACMTGKAARVAELEPRARTAHGDTPEFRAWAIAAAAMRGDHGSMRRHFDDFVDDGLPPGMLPQPLRTALQFAAGEAVLGMMASRAEALRGTPGLLQLAARTAMNVRKPELAIGLLDAAIDSGFPADRARLLKAKAYSALERGEEAIEELFLVIKDAMPKAMHPALWQAFDAAIEAATRPIKIASVIDGASQFRESGAAGILESLVDGDHAAAVAGFEKAAAEGAVDPYALFFILASCVEHNDADGARRILLERIDGLDLKLPEFGRLRHIVAGLPDAGLKAKVARRILDTGVCRGGEDLAFLRFEAAEGPEDIAAALGQCVEIFDAGHIAARLRLFLDDNTALLETAAVPEDTRAGLSKHLARTNTLLSDASILDQVRALASLCEDIYTARPPFAPEAAPKVSILAPVHRAEDLANLARNLKWQTYANLEPVVVANGPLYGSSLVEDALQDVPGCVLLHAPGNRVGVFLNKAVEAASGDILVRFDADDVYLPDYVSTAVHALVASRADMAAKNACFAYFQKSDALFLANAGPFLRDYRACHSYGSGASMVFTRDIAQRFRFHENVVRGEDYLFVEKLIAAGCNIFNLDPFNMIVVRHEDKDRHTWKASDYQAFGGRLDYVGTGDVAWCAGVPATLPLGEDIVPRLRHRGG